MRKIIPKYYFAILAISLLGLLLPFLAKSQDAESGISAIKNSYKQLLSEFKYDSALSLVNQYIVQKEKQEKWLEYSQGLLMISDVYFQMNLPDSMARYLDLANKVILKWKINESKLNFELNYFYGWISYKRQLPDSAEFYLNRSLAVLNDLQNDSLKVSTYKLLGNVFLVGRDFNLARQNYLKALKLENKRSGRSEITISSLYQNIGITFASQLQYDSASFYFKKSLSMKEKILHENDPKLARGYLNFSRFLSSTGEIIESLNYINKAEKIYFNSSGDGNTDLAGVYFNKGSVLINLENFDEALIYHELALDIYSKDQNTNNATLARIYVNLGIIYNAIGKYEDAITYLNKAAEMPIESEQKVKVYRLLGTCFDNLNDANNAEEYYSKAIDVSEKYLGNSHFQTASCYIRYGIHCNRKGDFKEALEYLNKAANIYISIFGNQNRDVSNILTNIGIVYHDMHKYQLALQYYQKALVSVQTTFKDTSIFSNPTLSELNEDFNVFHTLYRKSISFYELYKNVSGRFEDLQFAFKTAELSIKLLERIKSTFANDNAKLILTDKSNEIYNLAIRASAELYFKTQDIKFLNKSFTYSEKNKAAVLLSSIREAEAMQVGNIPDKIKDKERTLKNEISQYQNLILEEGYKISADSTKLTKWKKNLFAKKLQYDSLIIDLEKNYTTYYNLKYNAKVISLNEIQNQLGKASALIEYKLIDTTIFAYVVTRDTVLLSVVRVDTGFLSKIRNFTLLMSTFPKVDDARQGFKKYAINGYDIFNELFPFYPLIASKQHLMLIPDDYLGYLSFEALPCALPNSLTVDYKHLDYLLKHFSISYSYSGTLMFNRISPEVSNNKLLAMAPDYSNPGKETDSIYPDQRNIMQYLFPLVHTKQEVENISKVFDSKVLIGDQATETYFKDHCQSYSLLHFAMHTYIDDEDPLASKLIFSLKGDSLNDGFLNVFEIYNLNLKSQLAVLSACKTGVGRISQGEGIMSVARAFLYAGVPGIIMSLWSIEDVSSAEIMSQFYINLKDNMKKDEALRSAKLTYLENANQLQSHPYFWSAFVQIGDNSALNQSRSYRTLTLTWGSIIILLVVAGGIFYFRKSKTRK